MGVIVDLIFLLELFFSYVHQGNVGPGFWPLPRIYVKEAVAKNDAWHTAGLIFLFATASTLYSVRWTPICSRCFWPPSPACVWKLLFEVKRALGVCHSGYLVRGWDS